MLAAVSDGSLARRPGFIQGALLQSSPRWFFLEVEDLQRAYCETLDNDKSYLDALANAMQANFNAYYTRAAIEAMTGSRAAADAVIYMASCHLHGMAGCVRTTSNPSSVRPS